MYTLFSDFNVIKSKDGINHWIPFTEEEVGARDCFASHFMCDWLAGRMTEVAGRPPYQGDLFVDARPYHDAELVGSRVPRDRSLRLCVKDKLSPAARAVLDADRELWRYYHAQPNANPNASFYDIRLHFQGSTTDAKGKVRMNSESSDTKYTALIGDLRKAMKALARHIEPKVYEYGFLRR